MVRKNVSFQIHYRPIGTKWQGGGQKNPREIHRIEMNKKGRYNKRKMEVE